MSRLRIAVLISGQGETLQAIIDAQKENIISADIACVVSDNPNAFGLQRAKSEHITTAVFSVKELGGKAAFEQEIINYLTVQKVDLIVLAGFMRILSPRFVERFCGKIINIHPSLLPKYPGLNTYQRAIEAGEQEHGTTVHFVDDSVDGGAIILQAKVPIFADDGIEQVQLRVKEQERKIYPLVIQWFVSGRLKLINGLAYLDGELLGKQGYAVD